MKGRIKTAVLEVVNAVMDKKQPQSVTRFINETCVVRASRRLYQKGKEHGRVEIVLTIGAPNYSERALVKRSKQMAPGARRHYPVYLHLLWGRRQKRT